MVLGILPFAVGFGVASALSLEWNNGRKLRQTFRTLANHLGIEILSGPSMFGHQRLEGSVAGHRVTFSSPFFNYLQVEVIPTCALTPALWIAPRLLCTRPGRPTGDLACDAIYSVGGSPLHVAAAMRLETRDVLKSAREDQLCVSEGKIVAAGFWFPLLPEQLDCVVSQVHSALRLADVLPFDNQDTIELIGANVDNDPDPSVRLENLLLLLHQPGALRAAIRALRDPDPRLRLVAAAHAGSLDRITEQEALEALFASARLEVVQPALQVLASIGTLFGVAALRRRAPALADVPRLSFYLRRAIDAIEARHGHQGDGHLSLIEESEAGHVSVAMQGDLSVPDR